MQEQIRFDLVDVLDTLRRQRKFVLGITIAAAIIGAIFYLAGKKKYKATSEFLIANAQYTDRNNLFRQDRAVFIQYFAPEDDIDKVMALANSENVKGTIIKNTGLAKAYGLNPDDPNDGAKLYDRFSKNFEAKRTENQNMLLSYTDPDPKIAASVTNEAVKVLSQTYSWFFTEQRINALNSIQNKINETDSAINILTDSLAAVRDRYGIYDVFTGQQIVNGARGGGAGYGKALEQVRNMEATKDQLVGDRARMASVMNEFSTGNKAGDLPLIQVISPAYPPNKPAGLGLPLTVIACALAGLFFSSLWVLMVAYYRTLTAASRR